MSNEIISDTTPDKTSDDNCTLLPLAPARLGADELKTYEAEFSFAFGDNRIKNIALSGPYGAGKNTVMESWEEAHKNDHGFLHIQLAHFKDSGDVPESNQDLETEILNQLIHKTDPKLTPKSRFKRTRNIDIGRSRLIACALLVFVVLTFCFVRMLNTFTMQELLDLPCGGKIFFIVCGVLWALESIAGLTWLIKTSFLSKTLKKLKLFNAEFEIADIEGASTFDKSMDDILYLLNSSDCDIVVFEDLDRFGQIEIFEKLRSINSIANASRPATEKVLRFVYLIHDGLFQDSHDRTKFFDFIIPVIPYADTSNAYDLLKKGLSDIGVKPDDKFLRGLSVFIDDPRILHAIVDETYHYKHAHQGSWGRPLDSQDAKQLVGIIAFKEAFPNDFENLQIGRGYMHTLLNKRETLVADKRREIETQKADLENKLMRSNGELARNERELVLLFQTAQVAQLFMRRQGNISYSTSPTTIESFDSPDDILAAIDANDQRANEFRKIREELNSNPEFVERLKLVEAKETDRRAQISSRIDDLNKRTTELQRLPLRELFTNDESYLLHEDDLSRKEDYDELRFDYVKTSPYFDLIPFLIRSGAIDESYEKYMSNFYPMSLSHSDRNFVMSILGGRENVDKEYTIEAPQAVVLCMDGTSLSRRCARNRSLFKALLESGEPSQIKSFISGMKADDDQEFLMVYLASEEYMPRAFDSQKDMLCELISAALESSTLIDASSMRIAMHRLLADGDDLLDDSSLSALVKSRAESDADFLTKCKSDPKSVLEGLRKINYGAKTIRFMNSDSELIDGVYENRLFIADANLIADFLKHYGANPKSVNLIKLIDGICCENIAPDSDLLKNFVYDNLETFITSLVASSDEIIEANEESTCWIMNAETLTDETATVIASRLAGRPVSNIALIESVSRQSMLMSNDCVVASATNIFAYYTSCEFEIDNTLLEFFERNVPPENLNAQEAEKILGDDNKFLENLMASEISVAAFEKIVKGYQAAYPDFNIKGVNEEKVAVLIDSKTVPLNVHNLIFIRSEYNSLATHIAAIEPDKYVELVTGDTASLPFNENEALGLFSMENFPESLKVKLLNKFTSPVRLAEEYSPSLKAEICRTHFSPDDLELLPELYDSNDSDLRRAALDRSAESYRSIMAAEIEVPWRMVADMVKLISNAENREFVLDFIAWKLDKVDQIEKPTLRQDLIKCFTSIEEEKYISLLDGSQVQLPDTRSDKRLINLLVTYGLCTTDKRGLSSSGRIIVHPKGYSKARTSPQ